jgi:hypothetical protein
MKRVLILIAILLFGIGFETAAAPLSNPESSAYVAKVERPRPRRRRAVRRVRVRGTYIPYLPNSVPIPYLRLSPAMRREANRRLLNALIN